ncbi:class I SAM-dependent methyltransferase [Candidatus Pelagibacter sp. Uisw_134_02]|uniref:class I SAM-dependent methyltransferase n=1 Tax=Candidatus Pelagibacter sp. Uisw_134_02 TaxID=3230990 RepID=UPI0039ECA10E
MEKNHWQEKVYSKKLQLNIYPFQGVISFFKSKKFRKKSKIKILEIGCGAGNNLAFLAQEGFNVFGIDMSKSAISFAKKKFIQKKIKGTIKVGNIKKLDWPNNYFDYVIDRSVLTHNTNQDISIILDEIKRILKKNGTILSFDFFGSNTPDIKFGKRLQYNTYHKFTKGYFKLLGKTSFFNYKILKKLFNKFKIFDINQIITKNKNGKTMYEVFNLIAKKK